MHTHKPHLNEHLESDPYSLPKGELFVSFAIAMVAVTAIYLVVTLFSAAANWSQMASASAAALTAGLC